MNMLLASAVVAGTLGGMGLIALYLVHTFIGPIPDSEDGDDSSPIEKDIWYDDPCFDEKWWECGDDETGFFGDLRK